MQEKKEVKEKSKFRKFLKQPVLFIDFITIEILIALFRLIF